MESWGFSPVHAARIWKGLYLGLAETLGSLDDIPVRVRARLAADTRIGVLPVSIESESRDGHTRKYLLALADGERIEAVLMRFTGRVTVEPASAARRAAPWAASSAPPGRWDTGVT